MSQNNPEFQPLTCPLQGTSLIEASAGTGKTWNIAALYTRLIVLEQKSVDQILVVTFTKAATAELRTRLRLRLEGVLHLLTQNQELNAENIEDSFILDLLQQAFAPYDNPESARKALIQRIKHALSQFDQATIFTIHGFCQYVLSNYAFLCNTPFQTELNNDKIDDILIAIEQFYRQNVSNNSLLAQIVLEKNLLPETVYHSIKSYLARPQLQINIPEDCSEQYHAHAQALAETKQDLATQYQQVAQNILQLKTKIEQLQAQKVFKSNKPLTEAGWKIFDLLSNYQENQIDNFLGKNNKSYIRSLTFNDASVFMKGYDTSIFNDKEHAIIKQLAVFYEKINEFDELNKSVSLSDLKNQLVRRLEMQVLQFLRQHMENLKKQSPIRSFDDLLLDVYQALSKDNPHADELAKILANQWHIALIDEFQDTDDLQYAIFKRIFIDEQRALFLVGDPKQAIYKFRGADIRTYLAARESAQTHYTLNTNYRSHQKLLNGISALFQQHGKPFILDIAYSDIRANRAESLLMPSADGKREAAIKVRQIVHEDESFNKDKLSQRAADYCAREIAVALNRAERGELLIGEKPLQAGQIAVLVSSHTQANLISKSLKKLGIASVSAQKKSVFNTPEANALLALLAFFLNPKKLDLWRYVRTTLFNDTAQQLFDLNNNESALSQASALATEWHKEWQSKGIFVALNLFSEHYQLTAHFLSHQNERALSNFLQLSELLAQESEQNRSPEALYQWLEYKVQTAEESGSEAEQLRLETDENLVKIQTMHASKGLQYPLVFCPFMWDSKKTNLTGWHVLENSETQQKFLSNKEQLTEQDEENIKQENRSEALRLFYVAMTRAEEQLTIYTAPYNFQSSFKNNPFAHLFSIETEKEVDSAWQNFIAEQVQNPDTDFEWLDDKLEEESYIGNSDKQSYQALSYTPRTNGFQWIQQSSFTGLTRKMHESTPLENSDEMQPALDAAESFMMPSADGISNAPENLKEQENHEVKNDFDVFHFPRGTAAGVCLHEMLEHILPTQQATLPAEQQHEIIANSLNQYGFAPEWHDAAQKMVANTLTTPLPDGTPLANIAASNRIAEMNFAMYVQDFSLEKVKQALQNSNLPSAVLAHSRALDFATLNGFLTGFIDLSVLLDNGNVCVIDFKSNHLGNDLSDYSPQAIDAAIGEHHYYLQAWLYAIAMARYLKQRHALPETIHVRYLFLRGLDGTSQHGVWAWDIATATLQEWL
ncbi:MAG: exodeoxyribonuclease V subunit beta [Neisseria sp.]|nr:exodeoxyribonuclease V subunit beta [Neisseria sp.]